MNIEKIKKPSFAVIGMEGSTAEGEGFVQRLWDKANGRFAEVAALAKKNEDGSLAGIWGAMTDLSRSFMPWEDGFTKGLYLAGVECEDSAQPPEGWVRWEMPAFEYLRVRCEGGDTFGKMLTHMREEGIELAGAVQDFTDPTAGISYMLFPVKRL